jgi:hypothetical protein
MSITLTERSLLPVRRDGQLTGGIIMGGGGGGVSNAGGGSGGFNGEHNELTGLQGGFAASSSAEENEFYHLDETDYTNVGNLNSMAYEATSSYYTKTNLQTSGQAQVHWGNLTNVPSLVTISGTPSDNQIAVWTGASAIEGTSGLTYDGTNLSVTGTLLIDHIGEKTSSHNVVFDNNISSSTFTSGFAGTGWQNTLASSVYTLTIDNLVVRNKLQVYELDINKIQSINGGMIISCANGTSISAVSQGGGVYKIYFDEDGTNKQIQFAVNDYIKAQIWTGRETSSYVGLVTGVTHSATYGSAYITASTQSGTPWNIMDLVQIGSSSDTARQSLIYLTASDTNNPYIDMLAGVTNGSLTTHQVLRIGNLTGITDSLLGALSGYGMWSNNVYLTGKLVLPSAGITNEGSSASSVRIYAGGTYANRATAPFHVSQNGHLTSTLGTIGGWTIGATSITANNGGWAFYLDSTHGDASFMDVLVNGGLDSWNESVQSNTTLYWNTMHYFYATDFVGEHTLYLPADDSDTPNNMRARFLVITHSLGSGIGDTNKFHIDGNGFYIVRAGVEVTSFCIYEGRSVFMVFHGRSTGDPARARWYVISESL